jgi:hypothetical protein
MFVALINLGQEPVEIRHGDRVAQLVIAPVAHTLIEETDALDETSRGAGGFGSTGGHARTLGGTRFSSPKRKRGKPVAPITHSVAKSKSLGSELRFRRPRSVTT